MDISKNDFLDCQEIEEAGMRLGDLLNEREKRLKENYPNGFPLLPSFSQDESLDRAIAVFWEVYGTP